MPLYARPPLRPHAPSLRPSPSTPFKGTLTPVCAELQVCELRNLHGSLGLRYGRSKIEAVDGWLWVVPCRVRLRWVGFLFILYNKTLAICANVYRYPRSLAPHAGYSSYIRPASLFGNYDVWRHWMELASGRPLAVAADSLAGRARLRATDTDLHAG